MTLEFQDITSWAEQCRSALPPTDVHVWGIALHADERQASSLARCLSQEERQRADRLISQPHRMHFIAAHAALRMVLARYSGQCPDRLRILATPAGKPFLDPLEDAGSSLRFNLSHSHGRALIAVAKDREVGVDLESIQRKVDVMKLAGRFLSQSEVRDLETAEPSDRHERFLQLWVAREAVSKAQGTGITFPLHRAYVELSLAAKEARLIEGGRANDFPIRFLPLEPGWVGAVAAEREDWRVVLCPSIGV
jgi:4'-phosphopantetheinyl transferase